jgi:hypothetical protein
MGWGYNGWPLSPTWIVLNWFPISVAMSKGCVWLFGAIYPIT